MYNKLGFYTHDTTRQGVGDAINEIKPLVILNHAEDTTFWQNVRQTLPNAFIIGRIVKTPHEQNELLKDPAEGARRFADEVIARNEAYGPVFDAWVGLNEAVPGPHHFSNSQEMVDAYSRYDRFQVVFAERLRAEGVEAVAMNFGAGNFSDGRVWLEHFRGSLETYKYVGFHEYGWPTMWPGPVGATGCLLYRQVMRPIREKYGDKHRVIITECGLARMYVDVSGGDVGWNYPSDHRPPEEYWTSLRWYNEELNKDPYVLGACIFEVGHGGGWETFEILGTSIIDWLAELVRSLVPTEEVVPFALAEPSREPMDAFRREALAQLDALELKVDELQATLKAYRDFLRSR